MEKRGKHFSFETVELREAVAHGGVGPILFKRVSENKDGGAYNFIDFTRIPVGTDIGIHTHEHDNEEIYIVISGRGLMFLDGEEFEVSAGHVVVNRPGGTHSLKNNGETDLTLVVIEVPSGPN